MSSSDGFGPHALRVFLSLLFPLGLQAGDTLTQFATIDSLLAGIYEGHVDCAEVKAAGNFGIGTFEGIDGEMIVLGGVVYQVRADGTIRNVPDELLTPFATVLDFSAEESVAVEEIDGFGALDAFLKSVWSSSNYPVAIRLEGRFSAMRTRAPKAQSKPYPPLAKVVETQSVFEARDVEGTMVGFFVPAYFKGINVPGLHLHFLSDDHAFGGHVLDFELSEGNLEWDRAESIVLRLPEESDAFHAVDLEADRSTELQAVESDR